MQRDDRQTLSRWRCDLGRIFPSVGGNVGILSTGSSSRWAAPNEPISPQQLDDLVAPIALDPDPLLGEVLAASTYPMEIAEAEQWVRDHPHWKPSKMMDEAKNRTGIRAYRDWSRFRMCSPN